MKNHFDIKTNELKSLQIRYDDLEGSQSEKVSNKPSDERELSLKEFIISGFNMTKLYSMIYGISWNKGEEIRYSQKHDNSSMGTLNKPIESSCSSSAKKGLYFHFVQSADKAKVLNQSKPKTKNS